MIYMNPQEMMVVGLVLLGAIGLVVSKFLPRRRTSQNPFLGASSQKKVDPPAKKPEAPAPRQYTAGNPEVMVTDAGIHLSPRPHVTRVYYINGYPCHSWVEEKIIGSGTYYSSLIAPRGADLCTPALMVRSYYDVNGFLHRKYVAGYWLK